MSEQAPHPTGPRGGAAAMLLRLLIWLFILLAGLAVVLVLPMILVLTAMDGGRPGIWPVYLWVPVVFLACIWSVIAGLQAMDNPRGGRVALLAGIALVAFFSFPPFWLPES